MKQPALISTQVCESLSQVLKEAREAAGLSLNELSKRAGLNRQAVTFIEKGDRTPTMDSFVRIAGALGIKPAVLLSKAEELAGETDWTKLARQIQQGLKT